MNSIERRRFRRNCLLMIIAILIGLVVCALDDPTDRDGYRLSYEQRKEIIARQQHEAHSLEIIAAIMNQ